MLKTERVISPVLDTNIKDDLDNSPIWKDAFHEEEIFSELYDKYPNWYEYSIKFDGLKPVQFLKISKYILK